MKDVMSWLGRITRHLWNQSTELGAMVGWWYASISGSTVGLIPESTADLVQGLLARPRRRPGESLIERSACFPFGLCSNPLERPGVHGQRLVDLGGIYD